MSGTFFSPIATILSRGTEAHRGLRFGAKKSGVRARLTVTWKCAKQQLSNLRLPRSAVERRMFLDLENLAMD
jgi:hypothetical protein